MNPIKLLDYCIITLQKTVDFINISSYMKELLYKSFHDKLLHQCKA